MCFVIKFCLELTIRLCHFYKNVLCLQIESRGGFYSYRNDTEISHIRGTQNNLADIISRNPAGLTPEQIKQLTRPRDIMVATIQLYLDPQLKKGLKESAAFQDEVLKK